MIATVKEMSSKPFFKVGNFHIKLYHVGIALVLYYLMKNK